MTRTARVLAVVLLSAAQAEALTADLNADGKVDFAWASWVSDRPPRDPPPVNHVIP